MSLTAPADQFGALVREFELELIHLKQMIALAEEEHRDLVAGDTARLDAISSEKLVQLRALELDGRDARRISPRKASPPARAASPLAPCPPAAAGAS